MAPATVKLGRHEYEVVAQPLAYLEQELGDVFGALSGVQAPEDLADLDTNGGLPGETTPRPGRSGLGELTGPGYDILRVFIPGDPHTGEGGLMPEHEFRGYSTPELFAEGGRRDIARQAPTVPEIVGAFETVFRVNRLDIVKSLGKVLDSKLIEAFLKEAIGDGISQLLLSSLPASGTSASTSASEPPRTSVLSVA